MFIFGVINKSKLSENGEPGSETHLVRVQVRVLLTQSEEERFGVPTQRLFGRDEVGPSDIETDPA